MKPVENRRLGDASIDENAPKPWTTIGQGRQFGAFNSADGVEAPAYQHLDVRVGFRDGAENLSTTRLRFDIANPHLQLLVAGFPPLLFVRKALNLRDLASAT